MSGSSSGLLDKVLKGMEPLLQKESRSTSFGAKVAPCLKRADPSFMNSVTGSVCRAECSNTLQDIMLRDLMLNVNIMMVIVLNMLSIIVPSFIFQ
jgi:hypothetical protein